MRNTSDEVSLRLLESYNNLVEAALLMQRELIKTGVLLPENGRVMTRREMRGQTAVFCHLRQIEFTGTK